MLKWENARESLLLEVEGREIRINVNHSGYDDPGVVNGPPEGCYPPEFDLDYQILSAVDETKNHELSRDEIDDLMDNHNEEIIDIIMEG